MQRTELKRREWLRRTTRLRPVNRLRKAKTSARNFGVDGLRAAAVREMDCLAVPALLAWTEDGCPDFDGAPRPCWGDITAAHLDGARQAGGHGPGDASGLGPLCVGHHDEAGERRGSKREAFEERYDVDLVASVERIAVELDARGLP